MRLTRFLFAFLIPLVSLAACDSLVGPNTDRDAPTDLTY